MVQFFKRMSYTILKKMLEDRALGNNCDICRKVFKTETNYINHDKKFHMIKGTNIFKSDNCDNQFEDKNYLNLHITKDHINCSVCRKVFQKITSLNTHITAVHDKITVKHQIKKDSSLRIQKNKKSNSGNKIV